jgi:hypothetical protein
MRSTRRRNWILKRIVLGFAVVALVAPGAAKAKVDEGITGQPNSAQKIATVDSYVPFMTDFPRYESTVAADAGVQLADPKFGQSDGTSGVQVADPKYGQTEVRGYGLPHAGLNDYLATHPGAVVDQKNDVSAPQAVSSPGFDWSDAGIGAGLALLLLGLGIGALRATRHLGRTQTA